MIARKLLRDHMPSNNLKPHCMEVPNPMIRAFTSVRTKYESHKEVCKLQNEPDLSQWLLRNLYTFQLINSCNE